MFLIQILAPLHDNHQQPFIEGEFTQMRSELTERFGGLTVYTRAPAEGLWKQNGNQTSDDIVIFEIMAPTLDEVWWKEYRYILQDRFRQESIIIRAQGMQLL